MIILGFLPLLVLAGLVAAVVAGFRSMARHGEDDPTLDPAEVVKSVAVHGGLFLALIACSWGLIDVLQAAVEGDRIVGSNPDLPRGLALLIVGTPVYVLLLRAVEARHRDRSAAGDPAPHRGWTAYLVAALSTTLIASLVSATQITDRVTDEFDTFRPEELMQLVVWAGMWAAHWFVLRPRRGIRGDAHLAIGSIVGLGWFVSGVGAVVYRVLDEAYQSAFDDSLTGSYRISFWVVIALVGAAVWVWHWLIHFNAEGSVESDRRRSPLWFFTLIIAGVLPGLIAMLVAATTMVSGVLIWFIGSTDESAADFFEPSAILVTVLALGFITWAYHRWELDRGGPPERNEALRLHDYVVVAAGLLGTIGATAVVIGQLFEALSEGSRLAGDVEIGNTLIVAVTVLVAASVVWWTQWTRVERHRDADPVTESDSIWRKLYLTVAFGLGGLVLGVTAIWTLFVLLRDLLDAQTDHNTLDDLVSPVGWGVAVLGAVWYHLGVWRADRAVLEGVERPTPTSAGAGRSPLQPPPPRGEPAVVGMPPPATAEAASAATHGKPGRTAVLTPPNGVTVRPAEPTDAGEVYTLLRAADAEDAVATGRLSPRAAARTLRSVQIRISTDEVTVAVADGRIVGVAGVDGEVDAVVAPDRRHEGIATLLIAGG